MSTPAQFTFRAVDATDDKLVRFMVAKQQLVLLAAANRRTYLSPIFIFIWLALSYLFVDYLGWWPDTRYGFIAYLRPLPALASTFMPLIYIVDWANRPSVEKLGRDAVQGEDMADFVEYYSRNPASGFWQLKINDHFVGFVGVDANNAKITKTAVLRHLFVQDPYPPTGIYHDLLAHALKHCLTVTPGLVEQVTATDCSLNPHVEIHDLSENVPGYYKSHRETKIVIQEAVKNASPGPLDVIIDSIDTLCSDIGSVSATYKALYDIFSLIKARREPSRLILHIVGPSPLLPLLCQPAFSPSLTHVIAHPPALLVHLATEYLTLPPPLSPEPKFWAIFRPISERVSEAERVVLGPNGEGYSNDELVLEMIVRGHGDRRRGVERTLHGWLRSRGLLPLAEVALLAPLLSKSRTQDSDPANNLMEKVSFNLNLTAEQQTLRAQVPLPYEHQGSDQPRSSPAIYYDPDSGDDIDDDDPDEDLDI
uniref:Elongator complex protein 5 n=1 Tax=Mycena chlorophos TaxID=658473 RepID=A0ABQ0LC21_MYCCL|nr:predicted protein [Mycena chlorophos]